MKNEKQKENLGKAMLQIRRGKGDYLGIIFHNNPLKYMLCHNIFFSLRNKKKYF